MITLEELELFESKLLEIQTPNKQQSKCHNFSDDLIIKFINNIKFKELNIATLEVFTFIFSQIKTNKTVTDESYQNFYSLLMGKIQDEKSRIAFRSKLKEMGKRSNDALLQMIKESKKEEKDEKLFRNKLGGNKSSFTKHKSEINSLMLTFVNNNSIISRLTVKEADKFIILFKEKLSHIKDTPSDRTVKNWSKNHFGRGNCFKYLK